MFHSVGLGNFSFDSICLYYVDRAPLDFIACQLSTKNTIPRFSSKHLKACRLLYRSNEKKFSQMINLIRSVDP